MAKHCNLCTKEYNLEDYEPNMVIPSIMKDNGFCFDCAFWSWRLQHDISLILLHDDQERFLDAFYKDKNIDRKNPSYVDLDEYNLPDDKEKRDKYIITRYKSWYFGKPLILPDHTHLIFKPGIRRLRNLPSNVYQYLLTKDGMVIPYIMGTYDGYGLTHQGIIPDRFMKNDKMPFGFEVNAIILNDKDFVELQSMGIKLPLINIEHKVPEKILKKYFKNLY